MDRQYQIAMFGAFNVHSFGDTLFPMALENGIRKYLPLVEIELFSPGESSKGYGNDKVIHSYEEFDLIHEQRHFDAIVLGGGELLHNRDIAFEDNRIIYRGGQCGSSP